MRVKKTKSKKNLTIIKKVNLIHLMAIGPILLARGARALYDLVLRILAEVCMLRTPEEFLV